MGYVACDEQFIYGRPWCGQESIAASLEGVSARLARARGGFDSKYCADTRARSSADALGAMG